MDSRQGQLLAYLIEEFVETSAPVGSKLLAEKFDLQVSPATIRNDMALLEEEGYISQPHISAGRIPTEKAYRYWIFHAGVQELAKKEENLYRRAWDLDDAQSVKEVAKVLSDEAGNAVVVAMGADDFYYTGLSALFAQPEFADQSSTVSLARVMDHLDRTLAQLVRKLKEQSVFMGRENPFDRLCGFVGAPYACKSQKGCIGIVGPMRMHYPKNMGRIKCITELINE